MADSGDWKNLLNDVDVETAELIIQLQLQDINALAPEQPAATDRRPGRPDTQIAKGVYKRELTDCDAHITNRKLAENLEDDDNEIESTLEAAAFGWKYDEYTNTVERVSEPPPPVRRVACIACSDDYHPRDIVKAPCNHDYCRDCLENLYEGCMTDETLFPPRCCHQEFPWELVRHALTQQLRSRFGSKRVELETKDRTYCHVPTCSAFIKPDTYVGNGGKCPKIMLAHGWTCVDCKQAYHLGVCPKDEALDMLMQTAGRNDWQKCPGCRRIVELKTGCNHMTCICKTEFCYLCAELWKTCRCEQWNEERLLERAEVMVDEGRAGPANNNLNHEQQIAQAADHLREHHECVHERFKGVRQEGMDYQCEVCSGEYKTWIYQCRQCWMFICNTCRHNRM